MNLFYSPEEEGRYLSEHVLASVVKIISGAFFFQYFDML